MQLKQKFIYDLMIAGEIEPSKLLSVYVTKWQKKERTFWRDYKVAKTEYESFLHTQKAKQDESVINKSVKYQLNGLKTKTERLLILQKEVENCLVDLQNPELDTYEKVALRKNIKDLQSEISKIEGDYAPDKGEIIVNTPYSDSQVDKIIKSIRETKTH